MWDIRGETKDGGWYGIQGPSAVALEASQLGTCLDNLAGFTRGTVVDIEF